MRFGEQAVVLRADRGESRFRRSNTGPFGWNMAHDDGHTTSACGLRHGGSHRPAHRTIVVHELDDDATAVSRARTQQTWRARQLVPRPFDPVPLLPFAVGRRDPSPHHAGGIQEQDCENRQDRDIDDPVPPVTQSLGHLIPDASRVADRAEPKFAVAVWKRAPVATIIPLLAVVVLGWKTIGCAGGSGPCRQHGDQEQAYELKDSVHEGLFLSVSYE